MMQMCCGHLPWPQCFVILLSTTMKAIALHIPCRHASTFASQVNWLPCKQDYNASTYPWEQDPDCQLVKKLVLILNLNLHLRTGLGWANLAGAAFNSYPTTGSFARSAVAKYTGARSGLAGVVTAGLVGITLLCLTPVFNAMPMNALAAIVIAGVLPLLDFGKGISLFWVGPHHIVSCLLYSPTFSLFWVGPRYCIPSAVPSHLEATRGWVHRTSSLLTLYGGGIQ